MPQVLEMVKEKFAPKVDNEPTPFEVDEAVAKGAATFGFVKVLQDKIDQETRGLRKIGDSFRKIVVVDGVQPFYTDESGVSFVSLMDFMLNRDILG